MFYYTKSDYYILPFNTLTQTLSPFTSDTHKHAQTRKRKSKQTLTRIHDIHINSYTIFEENRLAYRLKMINIIYKINVLF